MIVSLHVASGGLVGALAGTRRRALALGPLAHLLGDRMPHHDLPDRRFEIASGTLGVLALAAVRGPLDPAVLGSISAALPDAEHVLRLPRPGGKKLFPSHRFYGWHRSGGVSAGAQLVAAGFLLGALVAAGLRAQGAVGSRSSSSSPPAAM
jgi:hypothetical protein